MSQRNNTLGAGSTKTAATGGAPVGRDEFISVAADDPRARPLLVDLEREYDARYGAAWGEPASAEINRYPVADFAAPRGAFVLLLRDGVAIAGGAFKVFDDSTSELKRIWTATAHRRQGLARRVVAELEAESSRRGYRTAYLTTGPRQPEARALYLSTGYTPLFDVTLPADQVVIHGFAKSLDGTTLDVARIQRAHDDSLVDFYAARPAYGDSGTNANTPVDAGLEVTL